MAQVYAFIATKTSFDVVLPTVTANQAEFNRRVAGAFRAMVGGRMTVGELKYMPLGNPIPNYLLCDGSVLDRVSFPELAAYLGDAFPGGDGLTTFALPDYINQPVETAPTAPVQDVDDSGTVSNEETVVTQPTEPGQTGGTTGGNVVSGGRPNRNPNENIP